MADTNKKTHPIRGLLWGLMSGIGLALLLVITKVIYLDLTNMIIITVAVMVIGVLWGIFGPAKSPKGPPPAGGGGEPPEASRFDEFGPPTADPEPLAAAEQPTAEPAPEPATDTPVEDAKAPAPDAPTSDAPAPDAKPTGETGGSVFDD